MLIYLFACLVLCVCSYLVPARNLALGPDMLLKIKQLTLPTKMIRNLAENLPRKVDTIITAKKGLNLEWDVQKVHIVVMVRCSQIFGHIFGAYLFVESLMEAILKAVTIHCRLMKC